ncbi:MAG: hypothetical protein Q7S74_01940 [Nanoarchaeota archaeon]|nr:hypothetical protein [Nanoarchaeota archaeon]
MITFDTRKHSREELFPEVVKDRRISDTLLIFGEDIYRMMVDLDYAQKYMEHGEQRMAMFCLKDATRELGAFQETIAYPPHYLPMIDLVAELYSSTVNKLNKLYDTQRQTQTGETS